MSTMDPLDPRVFGRADDDFDVATVAKGDGGRLSPRLLIDVWTRPRETMRRILKTDPRYLVLPLACAWGFQQSIDQAISRNFGDQTPTGAILGTALVLGPVSGVVELYTFGWLWSWAGRKLGGAGDAVAVRAAIAWAATPMVAALAVWLALYVAIGPELFMTATPNLDASPGLQALLLGGSLVTLVLPVWSFFLALKCVGEAHRFSAWRAWGAMFLGTLVIAVPLVAVFVGIAILTMMLAG